MAKALEGKAGIPRALEIWKELQVGKQGVEKKKWSEELLSEKTWANCYNAATYQQKKGHYQRLNDKIIRIFWDKAKANQRGYPPLKRHDGHIGMFTKALAILDVQTRVKTSVTHIGKAMAIKEGKKLEMNVAAEFSHGLYGKLVELGEDPRHASQIAIEAARAAKETKELAMMDKKEVLNGIAHGVIDVLNKNDDIIKKDKEMKKLTNGKDSLSKQNPNCDKKK